MKEDLANICANLTYDVRTLCKSIQRYLDLYVERSFQNDDLIFSSTLKILNGIGKLQ